MEVNGREIKFRRTVKTNCLLIEQSPGKDIRRYQERFSDADPVEAQFSAAFLIYAMNLGYEEWLSFKDKTHTPDPLTVDEIMTLDDTEIVALFKEAVAAMTADGKTTVETQPKPSKKKQGAATPRKSS